MFKDENGTVTEKFDCLGVLCNILYFDDMIERQPILPFKYNFKVGYLHPKEIEGSTVCGLTIYERGTLTPAIAGIVGLWSDDVDRLAELNDAGYTFSQIANWIDDYL